MDQGKPGSCRNCGTELSGEFCHHCGQSSVVVRRPARELMNDVVSNLLQWDSRLLHTLKNLFIRPGYLSLEWVNGRRMRYVPPFRLYIVASFLLFLLVGFAAQQGASNVEFVAEEATNVSEELTTALEEARANGEWLSEFTILAIMEVVEDPAAYVQKIITHLPKAAFLFLPIFALLHLAMEFRKNRYFIDYLVFSLHFHAFAFSLLTMIIVIGFVSQRAGEIANLLNLLVPVYAIIGIRKFNQQSWIKSLLKGTLIFGAYSIILGFGVACFFVTLLLI